jgi:SAM-dependent methyltransferase
MNIPSSLISPADYDRAEVLGARDIGDYMYSKIVPRVFVEAGYPYHVKGYEELARIADSVNFLPADKMLAANLGLTPEEFEWFKTVNRCVCELGEKYYGGRVYTKRGFIAAIRMFRIIRALCPDPGARILEVGCGNGYLGALLGLAGYKYVATDVTQALYIYQNHLWKSLFGDDFVDLCETPESAVNVWDSKRCVHLPWWTYYQMHEAVPSGGVDLVVSNRALLEMSDLARFYTMKLSKELLLNSPAGRHVAFEDWGGSRMTPKPYGAYQFEEAGFKLQHSEHNAFVFTVADRIPPGEVYAALPGRKPYHHYEYSKSASGDRFEGYETRQPVAEKRIAGQLLQSMSKTMSVATIGMDKIDGFLRDELGFDQLSWPEERFMDFIGRG